MPLPSVQGYLLGTRQPLDYVGKAIDAFTQVSAEFRATRAQNLAEQKDARQAGQEMKQGLQDDRMFQEDLIDKDLNRRLAIDDQAIQREKLGLEVQQFEMERDYIAPLKQDLLQAQIESNQALAESRRFGVESKRALQRQFGNEANEFNRELSTLESGPQIDPNGKGPTQESVDQYYDKVRNMNRRLGEMKPTWGDDPAAKQFLGAAEARLSRIPAFRYLQANDDLKTPEERAAIQDRRQLVLDSKLPFSADSDRANWLRENKARVSQWMRLPEDAFKTVVDGEITRLKENPIYNTAKPTFDIVGQRQLSERFNSAQLDYEMSENRLNQARSREKTNPTEIEELESEVSEKRLTVDFWRKKVDPESAARIDRSRRDPYFPKSPGETRRPLDPILNPATAPDREGAARSLFSNPP